MMKHQKKLATAVAGIAAVGSIVTGTLTASDAGARVYVKHGVKLSVSQTALVANNQLGTLFSGVPYIPNLIYNPVFGRMIQDDARAAARTGRCIEVGIGTPRGGGASNINYVTTWPRRFCAL